MKKILGTAVLSAALLSATAVSAANGDIAGHIYSTDIRAYINDVEVPSYNIGGRTVVVLEDITTEYQYNDELRVLVSRGVGFNPDYLISGEAEHAAVSGNIVGDIYETDIKTYFYDAEIPAYNIGGKTAVALEDLGGFKEYNDLGGRYFYDDTTRTIKLEMIYGKTYEILAPANLKMTLSENKQQLNAEFYGDAYSYGGNIDYNNQLVEFEEGKQPVLLPIMTTINGTEKQLGYLLGHKQKRIEYIGIEMNGEILTNGYVVNSETDDFKKVYELQEDYISFTQLFDDVTEEGKATVTIPELSKREQVIRDKTLENLYYEQDRLETDDYLFVYALGATPHGSNTHLLLIQNDGTYHDYRQDFEADNIWGTLTFGDVKIDKENEKCYFTAKEKKYVIDLKTGEMTEN